MAFVYSPKIVTDGLVFAVDAANRKSYTSGSNTWYDLSGNGNHGTLTNGPGFDEANGGSIVFDGSDDYVSHGSINTTSTSITVSVWVKSPNSLDSNDRKIFCFKKTTYPTFPYYYATFQLRKGNGTTGLYYQFNNSGTWYTCNLDSFMSNTNTWYNYTIVHDELEVKSYLNSTLSQTDNFLAPLDYSNSDILLLGYRTLSEYWRGNISGLSIYNRALTPSEITQNYNALKSRFGL